MGINSNTNENIKTSLDYRLTSLSSDALAAFVDLGIMCPYVIPHISLSEESFAAQLQKREVNMKTRYRSTMSKWENNFYKAERLKWSDQGEMGLRNSADSNPRCSINMMDMRILFYNKDNKLCSVYRHIAGKGREHLQDLRRHYTYRAGPVFAFNVPDPVHNKSITVPIGGSALQASMWSTEGLTVRTLLLFQTCPSEGFQ